MTKTQETPIRRPGLVPMARALVEVVEECWAELFLLYLFAVPLAFFLFIQLGGSAAAELLLLAVRAGSALIVCSLIYDHLLGNGSADLLSLHTRLGRVHRSALAWHAFLLLWVVLGGPFFSVVLLIVTLSGFGLVTVVGVCERLEGDLDGFRRSLELSQRNRLALTAWLVPFLLPGLAATFLVVDPIFKSPETFSLAAWFGLVALYVTADLFPMLALTVAYVGLAAVRGTFDDHYLPSTARRLADPGPGLVDFLPLPPDIERFRDTARFEVEYFPEGRDSTSMPEPDEAPVDPEEAQFMAEYFPEGTPDEQMEAVEPKPLAVAPWLFD